MNEEPKVQEDNRMVTGSTWMSFGSLFSRILGAIYIIPWYAWMGTQAEADSAHALYQIAYNTYAFFLAFSTAGVPSAISKQISHFNAIKEYEISKKIYRQGLVLMGITGIVSAILLYTLAPMIVEGSAIADQSAGVLVMRSLVPALLIIPSQAVTRGLFQGHSRMREPAISQILEQLARVVFILGATYTIRQLMQGDAVTAVAFSTFAAFVGAIFSTGYLMIRIKQVPTALNREISESENELNISTSSLLKDIIKTSIPFVIMSTGLTIFQTVDQQTFAPLMSFFNPEMAGDVIQRSYGIIQGNALKLSTIIVSFGSALAITSVPVMSDLISKKLYKDISYQFEQAVQLLMFIMIPAAIGMFVVAEPFYTLFYDTNTFGFHITRIYAITSLFMGLFLLLGNILQAIDFRRLGIYSLGIGLVVKIVTQPLFLYTVGESGILLSTIAGLGVTIFIMFRIMYKRIGFSATFLFRRTLLILLLTLIMGIVVFATGSLLDLFVNYNSSVQSLFALLTLGLVGIITYGYLTLKTRLAEKVIGAQAKNLRMKLKIK